MKRPKPIDVRSWMLGWVSAFIVQAVVTFIGPAHATIDTHHPAHERAERFVCEHPRHAERGHGLTIMREACE